MRKQKQKQTSSGAPGAVTFPEAASQLAALEKGLGLSSGLSRVERAQTRSSSRAVSDEFIELLATHAESNGGMVGGMPFDAAAAREVLTYVSATRSTVIAARRLAQGVEDDATGRRATVSDRSFAVYGALKRTVRTPEGESLKALYDQLRSEVRATRKPARTKAGAATVAANAGTAAASAKADAATGPAQAAPEPTAQAVTPPATAATGAVTPAKATSA